MNAKSTIEAREQSSYLSGGNAAYIEALYDTYMSTPEQLSAEWQAYFSALVPSGAAPDVSHHAIRSRLEQAAHSPPLPVAPTQGAEKQAAVTSLIEAYRRFGHLNACTDPLGSVAAKDPRLQLEHYGLSPADMDTEFCSGQLFAAPKMTLRDIEKKLKKIYTHTIGVQYSTISDETERHWLRDSVEQHLVDRNTLETATQHNILKQLIASSRLEKYLDTKFVGEKRFSIEGADTLIPMLDELAHRACQQGMKEIVIGMAHRGRLNVLLNIMGHSPAELFLEFEGRREYGMTSGDVKYHRGYSRDVMTSSGPIHLALAFNPSHLEFINPVIMGSVRARQDQCSGDQAARFGYAMPVQIHGDAAFAGQGVVMETLAMSQTRAHAVGGSIHIIVNNQVGFTTSDPRDARSSHYCTDLAKMLDAPIFHVNGDDPEAAVAVIQLALDYRNRFHKDVFIDLVCYRRHGHQEVDEPTATQPMMYQIIRQHPTTEAIYAKRLIAAGVVSEQDVQEWVDAYRSQLDRGEQVVQTHEGGLSKQYAARWSQFIDQQWTAPVEHRQTKASLDVLAARIAAVPTDFTLQRQVQTLMNNRQKMADGDLPVDWGFAETLAYATLAAEGHPVRLVGEDARRGTFYHRHAVVHDQLTGKQYMPLRYLSEDQARVQIYDSLLSEAAALGFEYGYASANPTGLTLWEAQFGDFANGAQVIIDQFISSGWQKWNRLSGVVLLLPHGYEGMGPEHSSARLERYLQLCAQKNIQVCVPTTPAQIYHLLRRQVLRPYRRPLVVLTPKSFLRHKLAVSSLADLQNGVFELLIDDAAVQDRAVVDRVVLCSGKVYYDLQEQRQAQQLNTVAIVRIEQLYPFPYDELTAVLNTYPHAKTIVWAQEEPKNQGAWFISRHRFIQCMASDQTLEYAGRAPSAAPAAGYPALHKQQQRQLVDLALGLAVSSSNS